MSAEPEPSSPSDAYKQIIDNLVRGSASIGARLVHEEGIYSRAPEHADLNSLVSALTAEQSGMLAEMLACERRSAIHDVLAELSWWVECRGLSFAYQGEPMPSQLGGMGLNGDFIGRLQGWDWP